MKAARVTMIERIWTIGSDPTCDLVVAESKVSRRHCLLRGTPSGYEIEDLGSTNGTYVNGQRITAPTPVRPEDQITLGLSVPFPWPGVLSLDARVKTPVDRRTQVDARVLAPSLPENPIPAPAVKKRPSRLLIVGVSLAALLVLAVGLTFVFSSGDGNDPGSKDPKELAGYYGHRSPVRALAVSSDGKLVASGDALGQIAVWEAQSRRERGMLPGQVGGVNSLAISPDSKLVASGGDDSQVRVWNLDKLEKRVTLPGHSQPVTSVAFYPAGTHLLSGGRDGRIILWNLSTEKSVRQYSLPAGEVRTLAITPDCLRFVSADSTGLVRVCELASGRVLAKFKVQQSGANGLAVSPLGDRALVCGNDGTLMLLDLDGKRAVARWSPTGPVVRATAVAFSMGGTRALSSDGEGKVSLWSCEDNQLLDSYSGHTKAVLCAAYFPNGVVALTGSADESVRLWRMPAPADLEKEKMAEVADRAKRTAAKFARFAGRMTLGREYLDQKKLDEALVEFNAAAADMDRSALEYEVASSAASKVKETLQKKSDYQALCESGKKAAEKKDYEKAMQDFQRAAAIFPERSEAEEGYKKASTAWQLKQALDESDVDLQLGFAGNAPSRGALHRANAFAYLMVRMEPPMAFVTTPIAWTIQVDTAVDFPDVAAKLQVRLVRKGQSEPIAVVEHPFVPGTRRQRFLGEGPPPSGGWVPANYELSTSLILSDRTQSMGDPVTFDIGLLRWEKKSFDVTPTAVHRGNFAFDTGMKADKGDALALEAKGAVAPAPLQFYRELMVDNKIADPVPSKPVGLKWLSDEMRLRKYTPVDIHANFSALMMRIGGQGWVPYYEDVPPQVLPTDGKIELSINSIVRTKLSGSSGPETVATKDATYWRPNSGKFQVTLYHGKFDFPSKPPLAVRPMLLLRFRE